MTSTEQDKQAMDNAADDAENELAGMFGGDEKQVTPVANWLKKWYMKAGYKRLGRILLEYAEQKEGVSDEMENLEK